MQFPQIFVTGATGRIGRMLQHFWAASAIGEGVRWQARRPQADRSLDWAVFDPLDGNAGRALAEAARGRDVILCLGGVTPERAAQADGCMTDNTALAKAAVRAGAETGARVLLTSSAAIYGSRTGLLSETMAPTPVSDYGRAKADMEEACVKLADRLGVRVTSLRIGNVAGADAILGNWRPGFALDRFPDGRTPRRSYIGPQTLARVLSDLCATPDLPAILNVAAPGVVEMGALLDAAGLDWTARPATGRAIAEVRLSVAMLERVTGFATADSQPEVMVAQRNRLTPGT
ncbi:NAD(P)-dependent oxidoreductase [Ruegeria sp. 2012CJ41-6]|uniref:NAD(P)-dependent oxidoreductase n=1 Tax=Ruegeria spongiae TaxID=2942209 RepID=A0ABT0Q701_9RHOB|nr:NAD(P)-dependent oxidoreductase [Ruegeria spongiae]MCL6285655.1 NAD(P)-dependent oxidoreductase [Ruegeria spongiae]